MLELWGMWSTPSLLSLPGLLWPGVVAPNRVLSMGICPKVNVIMQLELELTYYDSTVQRFNHYTMRTPTSIIWKVVYSKNRSNLAKSILRLSKRVVNQTVLHAWTEVCHQIFGSWEVQTMWNLQKKLRSVWRSTFKSKMFSNTLNMFATISHNFT